MIEFYNVLAFVADLFAKEVNNGPIVTAFFADHLPPNYIHIFNITLFVHSTVKNEISVHEF
jgi:hypothetical protein